MLANLPRYPLTHVDVNRVAQQTISSFGDTTSELDEVSANIANSFIIQHPEYSQLAARIWMSRLHKLVPSTFSEATAQMEELNVQLDPEYVDFILYNAEKLNGIIYQVYDMYQYDYFGVRTLAKSYLIRKPVTPPMVCKEMKSTTDNKTRRTLSFDNILETPQYLLLRVAITVSNYKQWKTYTKNQLTGLFDRITETYQMLATKSYIHATPTLFNSGMKSSTLASCYLLSIIDDSLEGIFETLTKCALVSQAMGGVGINISNVRACGSPISMNNGKSNGIVPMLKMFNSQARYVDQGGKRPGAIAVYMEPWHADIFDFLRITKKFGDEERITRDLFTAVWMCDLFMRRLKNNEQWSLMCPNLCPNLYKTHGKEFEELYEKYEQKQMYTRQVPAKQLWELILQMQLETGMPFLLYKDHINARNNTKHLGTIRGSNLCTEITLYTDKENVAVCNLASIALPQFARNAANQQDRCGKCGIYVINCKLEYNIYNANCSQCNGGFDYYGLYETARLVTRNLNRTIDIMTYPIAEAKHSNMNNRPLGIGVQGLSDVFTSLRIPWDGMRASTINRRIFETLYRATLHESCELAKLYGPYPNYKNSPTDVHNKLQHDLYNDWAVSFSQENDQANKFSLNHCYYEPSSPDDDWLCNLNSTPSNEIWSWPIMRDMIKKHGLRNSHRLAPMPTASTAQILGNCESIEPRTSNMFTRRVQSGEFIVVNNALVQDLMTMNLWTEDVRRVLIANRGSVQKMKIIPPYMRSIYRTVWEMPQRTIVEMTADRQPFLDQSQSQNLYMDPPDFLRLSNAHFYAWYNGLKTSTYYVHTKPAVNNVQFSLGSLSHSSKLAELSSENIDIDPCPIRRTDKHEHLDNIGLQANEDDDEDKICLSCQS